MSGVSRADWFGSGKPLAKQWHGKPVRRQGSRCRPEILVELLERIFPDEQGRVRYHYVLADYACRVIGGALLAGSDAMEARWVSREDLQSFDLAPITMRVVLRALDHRDTGK